MSRRHFTFDCSGETLVATVDDAPGTAGVVGRPSVASAENGRRMYEYLVEYIAGRLDA